MDAHNALQPETPPPARPQGHAPIQVGLRAVVIFAVALIIVAVVIHIVIGFLYVGYMDLSGREDRTSFFDAQRPPPPEPRLQVNPEIDMRIMRLREQQILGSYGWVDRSKGVVRIPIEEAMRRYVEQQSRPATQPAEGGRP